MRRLY
ncbi:e37a0064-d74c-4cdd-ab38-dd58dd9eeb60 [Thermothielavioides terrestris]